MAKQNSKSGTATMSKARKPERIATAIKSSRQIASSSSDARAAVEAAAQAAPLTSEQIAARAYEIWERKGKPTGLDLQNWQEAELELRADNGIAAH